MPRKNLRPLGGRPLVVWAIATALAVRDRLCGVVVSTDDPEIAAVARDAGAEVPFRRPAELATDEAASLPVLRHAAAFVEARDGAPLDWILLLQPTSPFCVVEDVRACLDMARDCDSVISVAEMTKHPLFAKKIDGGGWLVPFNLVEPEGLRRQDAAPPAYVRNGAVYLTRRDVLMEGNSIWGERIRPYIMPETRSINIDSELDLLVAEAMIQQGMVATPWERG